MLLVDEKYVKVVEEKGDPEVKDQDQTPAKAADEGAVAEEAAAVEGEEALIEGAADKGAHGEEEATKRVNVKDEAAAGDATEADVAKKDGSEGAATVKGEEVRPPEGAAAVEAEEALIEGAADKGAHREVEANEGGAVNEEEAATGPDAKGDQQTKPKKRKR